VALAARLMWASAAIYSFAHIAVKAHNLKAQVLGKMISLEPQIESHTKHSSP
jgi:hypothetical protein